MHSPVGSTSMEIAGSRVSGICKEQWHTIHPMSERTHSIQEVYVENNWVEPFGKILQKAKEQIESILQSRPAVKPIVIRRLHKSSVKANDKTYIDQSSCSVASNNATVTPDVPSSLLNIPIVSGSTDPAIIITEDDPMTNMVTTAVTPSLDNHETYTPTIRHIECPSLTSECLIMQNPSLQNTSSDVETITLYRSTQCIPTPEPCIQAMKTLKKKTVKKKIVTNSNMVLESKRKKLTKKCHVLLIDYYKTFGVIRFCGEGFNRPEDKNKTIHNNVKCANPSQLTSGVSINETENRRTVNKPTGRAKEKRKKAEGDMNEPSLKKCKSKVYSDVIVIPDSGSDDKTEPDKPEERKLVGEASNKENIGVEAESFVTVSGKSSGGKRTLSPSNQKDDNNVGDSSTHKTPTQPSDAVKLTISQVKNVLTKTIQLESSIDVDIDKGAVNIESEPELLVFDDQMSPNTVQMIIGSNENIVPEINCKPNSDAVDMSQLRGTQSIQSIEVVSTPIVSNMLINGSSKKDSNHRKNEETSTNNTKSNIKLKSLPQPTINDSFEIKKIESTKLSLLQGSKLFLIGVRENFKSLRDESLHPLVTALPIDTISIAKFDAANLSVQTHSKSLQRRDSNMSLSSITLWRDLTCFSCFKTFANNIEWNYHFKLTNCRQGNMLIK